MEIDFKSLPYTMKSLNRDPRGIPVPWFVDWIDGKPEFRAMNPAKYRRAIKEKRCWVCGSKYFTRCAFVAGPMCGVNRTTSEPPCHIDCARWSAINCPFLSNPRAVRREDDLVNNALTREKAPGFAITRNPGVTMVWITRSFEIWDDGKGKPLITMNDPETVEWYCEGRVATREEVDDSIAGGTPLLREVAKREAGGLEFLNQSIERFAKWLPAVQEEEITPSA
jgi:hypothetical protein